MSTVPKWNEERTAQLEESVGSERPVTVATVKRLAEELETNTRSVAAKLRKMDYEVESTAAAATKKFSDAQEEEIRAFVESNPNAYTYSEIAASVCNGEFSAKSIQGKILSMELNTKVKPTPKVEVEKTYSDAEEATLISMANSGAFIEDIAEKLGKAVNSVRGKCLSVRDQLTNGIPKLRESHAKVTVDPLEELGDKIAEMRVSEIATEIEKTERGVKYMLTHRGLSCKDYDGASKRAKIEEKKAS